MCPHTSPPGFRFYDARMSDLPSWHSERPSPRRRPPVWIVILIAGIVAVAATTWVIVTATSDRDSDAPLATSSYQYTGPAAPPPVQATPTAPTVATTTAPAPSRCTPAPDRLVEIINTSFTDSSYSLSNTAAVSRGTVTYIGGHIMQGDTRVSSANVWASEGPSVYAVSGSARQYSMLVDGRDLLDVNAGDEWGSELQDCVVRGGVA